MSGIPTIPEGSSPNVVDLNALDIQQLNNLKQQFEKDLEFFESTIHNLKFAQQKFVESREALKGVSKAGDDKEILVPLSDSLYVPGKLSDSKRILIDIGTGYYVEKTISEGKEYMNRKVNFLNSRIDELQPIYKQRFDVHRATTMMLQKKLELMQSAKSKTPTVSA